MCVTNDIGQALSEHPSEQLLISRIDDFDCPWEIGGYPGRAEELSSRSELAGKAHLPVVGDGGAHIGKRTAGEGLDLGDLFEGTSGVGLPQSAGEARFHRDRRQGMPEKVVEIARDARALVLGRQACQLRTAPPRAPDCPLSR